MGFLGHSSRNRIGSPDIAVLLAACLLAAPATAALVQAVKPTFEVASIRRNVTGEPSSNANTAILEARAGGFIAQNSTLESIIRYVYAIRDEQLSSGPAWVRRDRFDIQARAERDVTRDQILQMVQALLEDRFKLQLVKEARQADTYALAVGRPDQRLGPELRAQTESECAGRRAAANASGKVLLLPPIPPGGKRPTMFGVCSTMSALIANLQRTLKTTVEDRTGLTGLWDYTLTFSSQPAAIPTGDTSDAPSLFTAVREQLGLTLERRRGALDVYVIMSVEQPTEN